MSSFTEDEREEKLRHLMDVYGDGLKRLCCVYLRDMGLAEDAVQETFIKAYDHIDELLSGKIEETTIAGKKVFNVEDNYLIACFDSDVTEETIQAIAKQKPYYFVMRDSSMANDSVATNFDQIFATYSPDTVRKVL